MIKLRRGFTNKFSMLLSQIGFEDSDEPVRVGNRSCIQYFNFNSMRPWEKTMMLNHTGRTILNLSYFSDGTEVNPFEG